MGLFSGNLDIGIVALRPGRGSWGRGIVGRSVRQIGVEMARIEASRPRHGSGPDVPNRATLPPTNVC